MRPENEARLQKIQRVSRFLRGVCKVILGLFVLVFILILGALVAAGWIDNEIYVGFNGVSFDVRDLTVCGRLAVGALSAVVLGILFKGVYHLHRLLGNYSRGEFFTVDSAVQIRQWGVCYLLWSGANLIWPFMPHLISGAAVKPGVDIDLIVLTNGVILIVLSWFMEMAAEMREEQELIV